MSTSLFLIASQMQCNLCGAECVVAALAMLNPDYPELSAKYEGCEDDGFLLTYLDEIPPDALAQIRAHAKHYEIEHSLSTGEDYYMTICSCGGHFGDYYVSQHIFDKAFRSPADLSIELLTLDTPWTPSSSVSSSEALGHLLRSKQARNL